MNSPRQKKVFIIGAGLAGIAAALRLKKANFDVTVLEKNKDYGGKLSHFLWNDFRWDKGPSLFTSPELVDDLFLLYDKNPRDFFNFKKHPIACNYFFSDKSSLRFYGNSDQLKKEISEKISVAHSFKTQTYLERSKETYKRIGDFFVDNPPVSIRDVFKRDLIVRYPHFLTAKLRKTLHQYNHSALGDKKLVQIFDRFGTYNGSNPFKMSGLYSMIPHLEQNEGTFFPEGGMRSIVDSLYQLAVENGIKFLFNQNIQEVKLVDNLFYTIESNNVIYTADKLVCAIDHLPFYRHILNDNQLYEKYKRQERSSSALVFYWAVDCTIPELGLHNIFFSDDYRQEFEAIFKTKEFPSDPTVYVHLSSIAQPNDAAENSQNWFVMINLPAGVVPNIEQVKLLRQVIFARIKAHFQMDLENHILYENHWDAKGIEEDTGSFMGALYGASSNGKLAALKRHGNRQKKYPNLYFCGGTVHPGGGIPLVLKSAKIVAQLIKNEK